MPKAFVISTIDFPASSTVANVSRQSVINSDQDLLRTKPCWQMMTRLCSVRYWRAAFYQAAHDVRDNGGMGDHSTIGWVKSCAFLVYGDDDGRSPLRGKGTALDRKVEYFCQQYWKISLTWSKNGCMYRVWSKAIADCCFFHQRGYLFCWERKCPVCFLGQAWWTPGWKTIILR